MRYRLTEKDKRTIYKVCVKFELHRFFIYLFIGYRKCGLKQKKITRDRVISLWWEGGQYIWTLKP